MGKICAEPNDKFQDLFKYNRGNLTNANKDLRIFFKVHPVLRINKHKMPTCFDWRFWPCDCENLVKHYNRVYPMSLIDPIRRYSQVNNYLGVLVTLITQLQSPMLHS